MATWNSRGLRGSTLEDLVNRTNEQYREKGLALIQKIPTPITPVRMDKENRHITLAYFEQRSTVDYIGAVQGIPVCFDAKECAADTFPLANIHPHQVEFMQAFEKQGGVAFFLIFYSHENQFYYLTLRGSAIKNPETSVQFSYRSACTAKATRDPVISDPPLEKVTIVPSFFAP